MSRRNRKPKRWVNTDPVDILTTFGIQIGHDAGVAERAAVAVVVDHARSPWPVARDAFLAAMKAVR